MIPRTGDTEMFEGDMILNKEQKAMATASVRQDNKSAKPGQLARPAKPSESAIISRPGRSQGLLYKHLCHSLIR